MENKKFIVLDLLSMDTFEVDEEWLDSIPHKEDIKELERLKVNGSDELKVIYKNGKEVWYRNVHGTWGFPTVYE